MTFARDPAVLRVAAALACEAKDARAIVRALITVAPRAAPWIDAQDVAVTIGSEPKLKAALDALGGAGALVEALRRARIVELLADGGVGTGPEFEPLRLLLESERAEAAEKKRRQRERDTPGTDWGRARDSEGTSGGQAGDGRGTSRGPGGTVSGTGGDGCGDRPGLASPITRVIRARGNLLPPTPIDASNPAELDKWLNRFLTYRGYTGPSRLDTPQRSELLDYVAAGLPLEELEGILAEAADNGARKMVYLRPPLRRALEVIEAGQDQHEGRGPPGAAGDEPTDDD